MSGARKILYVSRFFPPVVVGGAEVMAHGLALGMKSLGYECHVLSGNTGLMKDGIHRVKYTPPNVYNANDIPAQSHHILARATWHAMDTFNPIAYAYIKALLKDVKFDIIHTHNIDSISASVWKAGHDVGLPVVHTSHDYHLFCPRATLLRRDGTVCVRAPIPCRAYRYSRIFPLRWVSRIVCPSQFMMEHYTTAGINCKKLMLIRNGVAETSTADAVSRLPASFLYVGQLEEHKGVRIMLDAFSAISDPRLRLTIAGRGSLSSLVVERAASDRRVIYHGFIDGVHRAELMATHKVLLVPSIWFENAPMVVVEALSAGMVPLVSSMGGLPELVKVAQCGKVVGDNSAWAWAEAMLSVVDSDLGSFARPADLTVAGMVAAYDDMYSELW